MILVTIFTAWKVFKYGVVSGPYLDTFHAVFVLVEVFTED